MKRIAPTFALALFPFEAFAQNQTSAGALEWMAWTWQTATFFGVIATLLLTMAVWERFRPGGAPRNPGALGINTTRGDRLFISLLSAAYVHLAWLGLGIGALLGAMLGTIGLGGLVPSEIPLWGATIISIILMLAVFRWV